MSDKSRRTYEEWEIGKRRNWKRFGNTIYVCMYQAQQDGNLSWGEHKHVWTDSPMKQVGKQELRKIRKELNKDNPVIKQRQKYWKKRDNVA